MNARKQVANLKLELLKKFLLEQIQNQNTNDIITNADNIGEIWCELASKQHFDLINQLIQSGISPTVDELDYSRVSDHSNTWYWLCDHVEGGKIVQLFLEKNIYPNADILNLTCTIDNENTWFILFKNSRCDIIGQLFDKNIYPSAEAINQVSAKFDVNGWYWLSGSDEFITAFKAILEKNIYPSADALNHIRNESNDSAWFCLAKSDGRRSIIKLMIEKNIWPNREVLNCLVKNYENTSAWYWILLDNTIFKSFLDKGIFPSEKTLNQIRAEKGDNIWYWLAVERNNFIFKLLLDKNICPTSQILNHLYPETNRSVWHLMAYPQSISLFNALIDKKIYPSAAALNSISRYDSASAWYKLASSNVGILIFKKLIELEIYPSREALNHVLENKKIWNKLAETKEGKDIIIDLINHDTLPDLHNYYQLLEDVEDLKKNPIVPLQNRMQNLQQLVNDFKLEEKDILSILLSREDKHNFYGFLYLYYLMTRNDAPQINLPNEIWFYIGSYLLSSKMISDCATHKKTTFGKYYLINELTNYSLKLFKPYEKRANSLKEHIKNEQNLVSIISKQYCMSKHPGKTAYQDAENSDEKYKQALTSSMKDDSFQMILKDGIKLTL